MKLLLDEMYSSRIARQLRSRGHDVLAVTEITELQSHSDSVVFAAAVQQGRAVVTENVDDFRVLLAAAVALGDKYAELVLVRADRFPRGDPRAMARLVAALDALLQAPDVQQGERWLLPPR